MDRAARQFANDERVAFHFFPHEQRAEPRFALPEVVHPDGGINQHDYGQRAAEVGVD